MLQCSQAARLRQPCLNVWRVGHRRAVGAYRCHGVASLHGSRVAPFSAVSSEEPTAAYVHLPFCKRKCRYCDFPVIAVGMNPPVDHVEDTMRAYVELVCQEIAASQKLNSGGPLKSVFFGGGTPSLLSLPLLETLLKALDAAFGIAVGAEISIEADPGTFDASRLRSYRGLGVTRFSVGMQAFQDQLLEVCGRGHDLRDVYRAIDALYAADVDNWSLDLMSGLPYLTPELWHRSLEAALDAAPQHISVYDLQVEEHTPFARLYRPGSNPLPSDDAAAAMYCTASNVLRGAGYEHYEVSNYSKPGHRCVHNMVYWEGRTFYGFGMGAASYLQGRRFSRPKRLHAYRRWVEEFSSVECETNTGTGERCPPSCTRSSGSRRDGLEGEGKGDEGGVLRGVPGGHLPPETPHDKLLDTVMLRLRLSDGLDLRGIPGKSVDGEPLATVIWRALRPHLDTGLVQYISAKENVQDACSYGWGSGRVHSRRRDGIGSVVDSIDSTSDEHGTSGGEAVKVRLTDPGGFVVSNDIISDVFAALDDDAESVDG